MLLPGGLARHRAPRAGLPPGPQRLMKGGRRRYVRCVARKLDTAHVIERVFGIYAGQAAVLLGLALIVYLLAALVDGVLLAGGLSVGALLLAGAITLVFSFIYNAMVVELVRDVQDGRLDQSVGELLRSVTPVLGQLLGAALIAGIGIMVGFALFIVPGLVLIAWWALVAPVVVIERPGAVAALRRSRELVRGNAYRVLGILVVILLVTFTVRSLLGSLSSDVAISAVLSLVAQVILAPLFAIASATMYFELKAIKADSALSTLEMPSAG